MDIKSEIAHVRFKTRDLNGLKVLTVEEMQADIFKDMKKYSSARFDDEVSVQNLCPRNDLG